MRTMHYFTDHLHHRLVLYLLHHPNQICGRCIQLFSIVCTERVYLISLKSYFLLNEYVGLFPKGSLWKYSRVQCFIATSLNMDFLFFHLKIALRTGKCVASGTSVKHRSSFHFVALCQCRRSHLQHCTLQRAPLCA